jgi:glycosyltransferase involved in cell wall biosynthesis
MKLLLLGPYPPPHGGVQTNLVAIRRYLVARGIPCPVINLTRHRRPDAGGVFYPKSPFRVLRLLLTLDYDIVHLHLGGSLTPRLLGLALACCLVPGRKAVLTFHSGGYASSPEGKTARPDTLRGFVFRRFDRVIAVNQEIVDLFRRLGVASNRLRLICPHSVSLPAGEVKLPEAIAAFYGAHAPVLLTVGLLEPEYDLPLQIMVLGRLRQRFPTAGLVIAGSGSLESDLLSRIAATPWAEHVLLCGDVPHEATLRAISQCDLFLRTTLYDGDSVAVREALHLGTPVIATDNGMRPKGVHLIPVSDPNSLCQACERLLASPAERHAGAGSGEENIRAVFELYRELAG